MMNGRHPSPDIYRIYEWTQRSGVELENTARLAACDGDRELRHRRQVHYELTPTLQCEGWKQKSVRSLCLVFPAPKLPYLDQNLNEGCEHVLIHQKRGAAAGGP